MIWLGKRLLTAVFLVWAVATLVFLAIHLVPGDPAELLLAQQGGSPDPSAVAALKAQLGLDRPVLVQYADAMLRLVRGDLGASLRDGTPVTAQIALRLPRTLELIGAAGLIAVLLGIPIGTLAAVNRDRPFDRIVSGFAGLTLAVPVFVLGTLCIMVFAQWLRWVPAGGYVPFAQDPGKHLLLLSMPALCIGLGLAGMVTRMTRTAVLDVMARDFVRTARAKGLRGTPILVHHVLRNALIPVVTVLALNLGGLLGGTVLVEFVFNWPGLSGYLVSAVGARDYPEVVGIILVISILFVLLNILVDMVYVALDPRVRQ
ncbi:ABC transporter permease [Prosthecomicrobium sp. N25]|uniref:ABC transporter permease n=1 Tax=Prosthecomicrobium sp. N25 TaxID=3129254 RepID=UPI0030774126